MQSVYEAALRSWSIPPAPTFAIGLSALVYLRGWWLLRRAGSPNVPPWRAVIFLLGLLSLWAALASPMDVFNSFVLTAHMLQHMTLMMVAPPLILLGAPLVPMVRGLPIFAAREFAGPFLNWSVAKRVGSTLTNPVFALLLMGVAMFAWHTPALYELALRSSTWHQVEHTCFRLTSLIFWWPGGPAVAQPRPMATLGHGALPADRRPSEHSVVCDFGILRSRALSVLFGRAPSVRVLRPRRSGRCWSHHVGCRIAGVRRARNNHRYSVSVEKIMARGNCLGPPPRDIAIRGVPIAPIWTSVFLAFPEDTMVARTDGSGLVPGSVCCCSFVFRRIAAGRIERRR